MVNQLIGATATLAVLIFMSFLGVFLSDDFAQFGIVGTLIWLGAVTWGKRDD